MDLLLIFILLFPLLECGEGAGMQQEKIKVGKRGAEIEVAIIDDYISVEIPVQIESSECLVTHSGVRFADGAVVSFAQCAQFEKSIKILNERGSPVSLKGLVAALVSFDLYETCVINPSRRLPEGTVEFLQQFVPGLLDIHNNLFPFVSRLMKGWVSCTAGSECESIRLTLEPSYHQITKKPFDKVGKLSVLNRMFEESKNITYAVKESCPLFIYTRFWFLLSALRKSDQEGELKAAGLELFDWCKNQRERKPEVAKISEKSGNILYALGALGSNRNAPFIIHRLLESCVVKHDGTLLPTSACVSQISQLLAHVDN